MPKKSTTKSVEYTRDEAVNRLTDLIDTIGKIVSEPTADRQAIPPLILEGVPIAAHLLLEPIQARAARELAMHEATLKHYAAMEKQADRQAEMADYMLREFKEMKAKAFPSRAKSTKRRSSVAPKWRSSEPSKRRKPSSR